MPLDDVRRHQGIGLGRDSQEGLFSDPCDAVSSAFRDLVIPFRFDLIGLRAGIYGGGL